MPKIKVARMILTMLNRKPKSPIIPSIHTQLMARGRNEMILSSILPKDNVRKRKTIIPQI
jgi:hypothetical protein